MVKLDMEIKCSNYPYLGSEKIAYKGLNYKPVCHSLCRNLPNDVLIKSEDITRPVARKSATGLVSFMKNSFNKFPKNFNTYKQNIEHTYQHKLIFAQIEKELFGKNSTDSITHDLDKLILYILGFPHDFVSKFHRQISEHHIDNNKAKNLRSMLCDNIASSPEFKPEKKYSLRDFYHKSKDLQNVQGFGEILEKYQYGEALDFQKIKNDFKLNQTNYRHVLKKALSVLFI